MTDSFKIVIPARYASSRLPGKPLIDLNGMPMIQRVYNCALSAGAEQVVIATDDERIVEVAKSFNADVCLTSTEHQSGTDRLAEVCKKYAWADDTIVVNLQGDEPLTPALILQQVAKNLANNKTAGMATLSTAIQNESDLFDSNIVKVISNIKGMAMYFSRACIPFDRDKAINLTDSAECIYQRHLGVYAYRVSFLNSYADLPVCELESIEKLEQLRALYNAVDIHVDEAKVFPGPGIDTPEDVKKVCQLLRALDE